MDHHLVVEPHYHVSFHVNDFPFFLMRVEDADKAIKSFLPLCTLFFKTSKLEYIEEVAWDAVNHDNDDEVFVVSAGDGPYSLLLYSCDSRCVSSPSFN